MREFTKAAISYGWASTCFQLQQLVNIAAGESGARDSKAAVAFNAVAQATAEQLGPTLRATYGAGDAMQRGLVNMMFGMTGNWVPTCDLPGPQGRARQSLGSDLAGSSSDAAPLRPTWRDAKRSDVFPRPAAVAAGDDGRAVEPGWGPMP